MSAVKPQAEKKGRGHPKPLVLKHRLVVLVDSQLRGAVSHAALAADISEGELCRIVLRKAFIAAPKTSTDKQPDAVTLDRKGQRNWLRDLATEQR